MSTSRRYPRDLNGIRLQSRHFHIIAKIMSLVKNDMVIDEACEILKQTNNKFDKDFFKQAVRNYEHDQTSAR